jgi:2-(1,2-epoxy-1,2-dihydrophenyl)acetyl-CoA isomerase
MADEVLRIERRARIAILTLNRPDRLNALSGALRTALVGACQELRDDDDVWAVVLTGAGRGFCSGVDLRAPRPDSEQATSRQERLDMDGWVGRQAMAVYRTLDKPIIAAVNGVAAGAGMSLALSCDMRVGSELTRCKQERGMRFAL